MYSALSFDAGLYKPLSLGSGRLTHFVESMEPRVEYG